MSEGNKKKGSLTALSSFSSGKGTMSYLPFPFPTAEQMLGTQYKG